MAGIGYEKQVIQMEYILLSLGDKPAAEGIGGVISSALLALGTLALIYLVLVAIDRYHKKHGSGDNDSTQQMPPDSGSDSFRKVLTEEIKKKDEENGSRHI